MSFTHKRWNLYDLVKENDCECENVRYEELLKRIIVGSFFIFFLIYVDFPLF